MTPAFKTMMYKVIRDVTTNLTLTAAIIIMVLVGLTQFLKVHLQISGSALILGIFGTTLAYTGNSFVSDALGRYDAHGLPQYIWGNRMQTIGFALTITALLVK